MPGVNAFKCSHCSCIFKKITSLNVHVAKSHATYKDGSSIFSVISRLKELDVQPKQLNEKVEGSYYVKLSESFLDGTVKRYLVKQKKVNNVRWYICTYCSKEFKKPSDVIRHTRTHTKEKPFMVSFFLLNIYILVLSKLVRFIL